MPKGEKNFRLRGIYWRRWLRLFFYYLLLSSSALAKNTAEIQAAREREQYLKDKYLEGEYLKGSKDDLFSNVQIVPVRLKFAYDYLQSDNIEGAQSQCEQILEGSYSLTDVQKAVAIYWEAAHKSTDFIDMEKAWYFVERAQALYRKDSIIGEQYFRISLEYHFLNARKQISNNDFDAVVKSLTILEGKLNFLSGDDFNYFSSEFFNIRALYLAAKFEAGGSLEKENVERIYEDCKNVIKISYDMEQVEYAVETFSKVREFFKPDDVVTFFENALVEQPHNPLIYIRYVNVLGELKYAQKALEMAQVGILSYINEKDLDRKKRVKPYMIGFCEGIGLSKYCRKKGLSIENLSEKDVSQYFQDLLDRLGEEQSVLREIEFRGQVIESHMPTTEFPGHAQFLPNERQKSNSVIKVIIAAVISGFAFLILRFMRSNERAVLPILRRPRIIGPDSTTSENYEVPPELELSTLRSQWETLRQNNELQLDSYNNFIKRIKDFDFKLMDYDEIVRIAERAIRYRSNECQDITDRLQRSLQILLRLKADWSKSCSVEVAQEKYAALQEAYQLLSELEFSVGNIEQIKEQLSLLKKVSNDYLSYKRDGGQALAESLNLLGKFSKNQELIGQKLDELERLVDQEPATNRMPLPFFNGENRQVNDNGGQSYGDIPRFER
ncbi:MAG: hypothetical protein AMJ43_05395 [Coxiella sp. DG_40]|nr:MAG: hypothetical protein AMJ43_05395 [Coxiella sp. DG_40]